MIIIIFTTTDHGWFHEELPLWIFSAKVSRYITDYVGMCYTMIVTFVGIYGHFERIDSVGTALWTETMSELCVQHQQNQKLALIVTVAATVEVWTQVFDSDEQLI